MKSDTVDQRMKQFEESLCGGRELRVWHYSLTQDENGDPSPEAVLYFMDAEHDPVRVSFDFDGYIVLDTEEYAHLTLGCQTLRWLAKKCAEVERAVEQWRNDEGGPAQAAWGPYREVFPDLAD